MPSAPNGTIERTISPRPDLLSFDLLGRIYEEDMHWMAAEVESAFDGFDEVDMLLVMRPFDGADAGALVDLKLMKVQFRSLGKVRRYAVVGAPAWARTMIGAFDLVVPVNAKTFDLAEEREAQLWVSGAAAQPG